ncbi:hypothetical protein [Haloarchaeobius amylolyticus]|uniref:hypothetical protein n=1 Tax=Haloarchaeobius amylolyticus TaxID=1198296 RepID=UPI00227200B2|nr:hypothetical protein [Haloarchaeobius amylolyticus]
MPRAPHSSTRRAFLAGTASAGLAALAGCLDGSLGGGTGTETTVATTPGTTPKTDSGTHPTSATGTSYPDTEVAFPGGPKSRPERPDELTRATAREFVHEHEYNWVYNQLWYSEHTEVDLSCEVHSVEQVRDGYEVLVSCTGYSNTGGESTENGTATQVHADWFTQWFVYYVDADTIARRQATEDEKDEAQG